MTTNEIKALFDAAGISYRYARKQFAVITDPNNINRETSCKCYEVHTTEDEAYQCVWKAYINDDLLGT